MNFVRCEQCGAKALIAASQCPKCTHPLLLRDFRGDVVPLAHCHKCDTYYRRSLGGCRWCGTRATGISLPRRVIVAGAVVVLAVAAVGSWQWRAARVRAAAAALADSLGGTELASSAAGDVAVSASPAPAVPPAPTDTSASDSARVDSLAADAEREAVPPPPAVVPSPLPTPAGAPRPARYAGPWTSGVAREWVNVRASNSPGSEVVGVVTPNTRVQLGELRAGWRRVRSAGVEGWADARFFTSDSLPR